MTSISFLPPRGTATSLRKMWFIRVPPLPALVSYCYFLIPVKVNIVLLRSQDKRDSLPATFRQAQLQACWPSARGSYGEEATVYSRAIVMVITFHPTWMPLKSKEELWAHAKQNRMAYRLATSILGWLQTKEAHVLQTKAIWIPRDFAIERNKSADILICVHRYVGIIMSPWYLIFQLCTSS